MSAVSHHELRVDVSLEGTTPPRRLFRYAASGVGLVTASLVTAALVTAALVGSGVHTTVDAGVADWGAGLVPGWFVSSMESFTHLGGGEILYPIALAVTFVAYRRRDYQAVAFLAMAVVGQSLLSNGLKLSFARSRPDFAQLAEWTGWSFPSGHTMAAAAVLMALALTVGRWIPSPSRKILIGVAIVAAVVVALSRVVLGVHWFSDVAAGLLLGWGWVAFSHRLAHRLVPAKSPRSLGTTPEPSETL